MTTLEIAFKFNFFTCVGVHRLMEDKLIKKILYNQVFRVHLLLWLTFFILKLAVLMFTGEKYFFLDFALSHLLIMAVFYTSVFYVLPLYQRINFFLFLLITIFQFLTYGMVRYLIKFLLVSSIMGVYTPINFHGFIAEVFYLFFQFYIVSIGYRYSLNREQRLRRIEEEKSIQQDRATELEKDYLHTELAFLKAQINPHFLYNTLSFLYTKAVKTSTVLAESIMALAEIMRYALSNDADSNGTIMVEDEVIQVRNLLKIYQLRYDGDFFVDFQLKGDLEGHRIIPLVIITIIENSFKHGEFNDAANPILIEIIFEDNRITLKCFNKKKKINNRDKGGLGLKNIIKRIAAHYENNHEYTVIETEETYATNLTINL